MEKSNWKWFSSYSTQLHLKINSHEKKLSHRDENAYKINIQLDIYFPFKVLLAGLLN